MSGSIADLFIVIAETDRIYKDDLVESKCTAFIVEKQFGGITTQKSDILLDCDVADVQFNNTPVPAGMKLFSYISKIFGSVWVLHNCLKIFTKSSVKLIQ